MLNSIPQHPYPNGARVHDATETDDNGLRIGTATVVEVRRDHDGLFRYLVQSDSGGRQEWPSYFTIPAGLWSRGEASDAGSLLSAPTGPAPAGRTETTPAEPG